MVLDFQIKDSAASSGDKSKTVEHISGGIEAHATGFVFTFFSHLLCAVGR
jgi:hypothetical protein